MKCAVLSGQCAVWNMPTQRMVSPLFIACRIALVLGQRGQHVVGPFVVRGIGCGQKIREKEDLDHPEYDHDLDKDDLPQLASKDHGPEAVHIERIHVFDKGRHGLFPGFTVCLVSREPPGTGNDGGRDIYQKEITVNP